MLAKSPARPFVAFHGFDFTGLTCADPLLAKESMRTEIGAKSSRWALTFGAIHARHTGSSRNRIFPSSDRSNIAFEEHFGPVMSSSRSPKYVSAPVT
jgi:hypothetical protein